MPKYAYFIRITSSYENCVSIISRWALECDKMAVYEHVGEKTEKVHIHIVMEGSRVQSKQLRNQAQQVTTVPLAGNQNCAMTKWDLSEIPLIYMTKGKYDPKYLRGWSEAEAAEWKTKYVEPTPKQQKMNDLKKIFEENYTYETINKLWKEIRSEDNPISIQLFLRKKVMKDSLELNHQMMGPKTVTDARTLYLTYCWRNGILIPKDDPYKKYVTWQKPDRPDGID